MKPTLTFITLLLVLVSFGQPTIVWQNKANFPATSRIDFGSFLIDSNFYIVGGGDTTLHQYNEVWRYNIPNDSWHKMNNIPAGAPAVIPAFTLFGKGYFCTGLDSIGCNSQFWEYYPAVDTWSRKPDFPGPYREGATTFTYSNRAYLCFGYHCGSMLNDIWEYDPIIETWTQKDSLPSFGRYYTSISVVDSYACCYGGIAANNTNTSETWRYNIKSNLWQQMSSIPNTFRAAPISYPLKNSILIGYGVNYNPQNPSDMYLHKVYSDTWLSISCSNFVDSIGSSGTFMIGKTGYCFGGYKNSNFPFSFYTDMWSFDATNIYDFTDIEEPQSLLPLHLYPNPNTGTMTLVSEGLLHQSYTIYDLLGQPIASGIITNNKQLIKLPDVQEGLYLLNVTGSPHPIRFTIVK